MKKFVKYLFVAPLSLTTIIPVVGCSCGSSEDPIHDTIPEDKLVIENGILSGFVDGFDPTIYKELSIPSTVTTIKASAFENLFNSNECTLTKISIPSSVTTIESKAFYGNTKVQTLSLSSFTTTEGYTWASDAFGESAANGSIIYPSTNDLDIQDQIDFLLCDAGLNVGWFDLTKEREVDSTYFNINKSTGALDGFTDEYYSTPHHVLFNKLNIPAYIPKISEYAFCDKDSLTTKIDNLTTINFLVDAETEQTAITEIEQYAFYGAQFTNELVIPYGITTIGDYAFANCNKFSSISLIDGLIKIGESSFNGCASLTTIEFPSTLEKLGKAAFANCSSLNYIDVTDINSLPTGWDASVDTWSGIASSGNIICNPSYSEDWTTYFYTTSKQFPEWTITDKINVLEGYEPVATPIEVSEAKTSTQIESIYYTALKYYADILADDLYYSFAKWIDTSKDMYNFTTFKIRIENASSIQSEKTISFIMYYDIEGSLTVTGDKFSVTNGTIKFRDIPFSSLLIGQEETGSYKTLTCSGFDEITDEWLIKATETLTWTPASGSPTTETKTIKLDQDTIKTHTIPFNIKDDGVLLGLNWLVTKPSSNQFSLLSPYLSKIEIK